MKKILLTMLLAAMVAGCSTPEDQFKKATREYAVQQIAQYYHADVKPKDIKITQCDYDFESPYRGSVYYAELTKNRYDSESLDRFTDLSDVWTDPDGNKDKWNYGEDRKPMYKCEAFVNGDSISFYVRWCSTDLNEKCFTSSMAAREMLIGYNLQILQLF